MHFMYLMIIGSKVMDARRARVIAPFSFASDGTRSSVHGGFAPRVAFYRRRWSGLRQVCVGSLRGVSEGAGSTRERSRGRPVSNLGIFARVAIGRILPRGNA